MPTSDSFSAVSIGTATIHEKIEGLRTELRVLLDQTSDPQQRETLIRQRHLLAEKSYHLFIKEISANDSDFKAAARDLKKATTAAKEAQEDLDKVATLFKSVAQVLKIIDKILGVLAGI